MNFLRLKIFKIILNITVISVILLFCSDPTYAFDLKGQIKEYFRTKVEESDSFIERFNSRSDQYVNRPTTLITKMTQGGFSLLEKRQGLSEQNKYYQDIKYSCLRKVGFRLGVVEGTKDFVTGTVSLLAYLESLPARTINLAYNVKEKPQAYKDKVTAGAKNVAGVLVNPWSVFNNIYQMGKSKLEEAKNDPLKMGVLQGEVAVFGGTMLLGGGQVKSVSIVNKAVNTGKTGLSAKLPAFEFPQINLGFGITAPTTASVTGKGYTAKAFHAQLEDIFTMKTQAVDSQIATSKAALEKYSSAETKAVVGKYPLNAEADLESYPWMLNKHVPQKTQNDILVWAEEKFDVWREALSLSERTAISQYTKRDFLTINPVLRGMKKESDYFMAKVEKQISLISGALQKSELPEKIFLFRTINSHYLGDLEKIKPQQLIGKTIQEKGFLSTSLVPLFYYPGRLSMVIKAPEKINGAFLGSLSKYSGECEFLLDKGQELLIKNAKRIDDYKESLLIEAEILP